jgi:type IV pilus assembly protein PilO
LSDGHMNFKGIKIISLFEKIEKIKLLHRILIFVGTILLLGGIFIFMIYLPKVGEVARLQKEIEEIELKVSRARIKSKNLSKFKVEQTEVEKEFRQALNLLPDKREIPSLLTNINHLGMESNLEFHLFSPEGERPRDFYIEIPVSLIISGKYHNFLSFFDKVGRMKRIVNIVDVSMVPEKSLSTRLITTCKAVTYRFKGPAGEGNKKEKN